MQKTFWYLAFTRSSIISYDVSSLSKNTRLTANFFIDYRPETLQLQQTSTWAQGVPNEYSPPFCKQVFVLWDNT